MLEQRNGAFVLLRSFSKKISIRNQNTLMGFPLKTQHGKPKTIKDYNIFWTLENITMILTAREEVCKHAFLILGINEFFIDG